VVALLSACALGGCGPKKTAGPVTAAPKADDDPLARHDDGADDGLGITGVYEGDLSPDEVSETMRGAAPGVSACFGAGKARNPHLLGAVAIRVIVARDGHVREAAIEEADLGDRETERCLVDVAIGLKFPKPRGGEVQMVLPLSFTPASARGGLVERPPTPLEIAAVHEAVEKACKPAAGAGYLLTVYVTGAGKPVGAGFASLDIVDPLFADCATGAAVTVTYGKAAGAADKIKIPGN
jgi:hypothetical protein